MPTFASIEGKNSDLRRKALQGAMFLAPYSATAVTKLTGAGGALAALPTGYVSGGHLTTDGVTVARAIERSSSTSWGRTQPTREDITSDVATITAVLQETNKMTLQLYTGLDLSAVTPDTNGEIHMQKPSTLPDRYWRVLVLSVDTTAQGDFYLARFFPRVKVTDYADSTWANNDEGITWGVTLTTYTDDVLGFSQDDITGGPGATARNTAMGFV